MALRVGARGCRDRAAMLTVLLAGRLAGSAWSAAEDSPSPSAPIDVPSDQAAQLHLGWLPRISSYPPAFRGRFEDFGVTVSLHLNDQYQGVIGGGLDMNGFRNSASMDAYLAFDLDPIGAIRGGDILIHLQSNWGGGINDRTGSTYQVNDDADGDLGFHVAQLRYRQRMLDNRVVMTVGFLDFQTIVDCNEFANSEDKQFLNLVLDNNPLVPLNIGLGASLMFQPTPWYSLTLGAGDADAVLYKPGFSTAFHDDNHWFAYLEQNVKLRLPSNRGPLDGNYRVGVVYDPRIRPVFHDPKDERAPANRGDDYGLYVSVDQMVIRESQHDKQGLGVFGRFGYRTAATNAFARFYSAGLSYTGLLPERDEDVLGFGAAMNQVSDDLRHKVNSGADRELIYELYYAIKVNRRLTITPDVQYIDNPGATGDLSHAFVGGLRVRLSMDRS